MKWIKRVSTPLTVVAKVIDSLSTNLNTSTNAPSIRAVQELATDLEERIDNADSQITDILTQIYPVGAIYISVNDTNPSSIFGGTWEKVEDRFLLASGSTYINGATGGEAEHTLTEQEIPWHSHTYAETMNVSPHALTIEEMPAHTHSVSNNGTMAASVSGSGSMLTTYNPLNPTTYITESTGGGQGHSHGIYQESRQTGKYGYTSPTHNNMPPYLVVNMWVRVS